MGINPFVFLEGKLEPVNDEGVLYRSSLAHVLDIIEAYSEALSDLRQNYRDNTLTPLIGRFKQDGFPPELQTHGRPSFPEYGAGKQIALWDTEEIVLGPVPVLSEQHFKYINELKELIAQALILPSLRGEAAAGTAGVTFSSQVRMAAAKLDPVIAAMTRAAEHVCKLLLRSPAALSREFEDYPDKVYVIDSKGHKIGMGPKDAEGWEHLLEPIIQKVLPYNAMLDMSQAQGAKRLAFLPDDFIGERYLRLENVQNLIRRKRRQDLLASIFPLLAQQMTQRASIALQEMTPEELQEVTELLASASPALQQALGSGVPGSYLQGQANVRRTATGQQLSQGQAMQMGGETPMAGVMP